MSLTTALSIAQNSLLNTQRQVGVVSRNVADAQNPNYARRSAALESLSPGVRIMEVRRATNDILFRQNLTALSGYTAQSKVVEGLDRLSLMVNGPDQANSVATALGHLQNAIQFYSSTPSNTALADSAVEAARTVVRALNSGSQNIQQFRGDMDRQIATAVDELNAFLAEFKGLNDEIRNGTMTGRDVNDALDRRDAVLMSIAEMVPISTITRQGNDVMILTADGATLFETIPRVVSYTPTPSYGAATVGDGVRVDGVPIVSGFGGNTTAAGSIAAMMQMRDTVATGMQVQLDEMARGLAEAIPGLMTWTGDSADPGFAAIVSLNPAIDVSQNGNPHLLRDGIPGSILDGSNPDGNSSYSELLIGYLTALDVPQTFVTASGGTATFSLMDYSTDAISWLEASRKEAATGAETKNAMIMRTSAALSNFVNVNVDEEMALLLELEHSYAASARILQTIDKMLASLLEAVG